MTGRGFKYLHRPTTRRDADEQQSLAEMVRWRRGKLREESSDGSRKGLVGNDARIGQRLLVKVYSQAQDPYITAVGRSTPGATPSAIHEDQPVATATSTAQPPSTRGTRSPDIHYLRIGHAQQHKDGKTRRKLFYEPAATTVTDCTTKNDNKAAASLSPNIRRKSTWPPGDDQPEQTYRSSESVTAIPIWFTSTIPGLFHPFDDLGGSYSGWSCCP
jgi:hypothetical protein